MGGWVGGGGGLFLWPRLPPLTFRAASLQVPFEPARLGSSVCVRSSSGSDLSSESTETVSRAGFV